VDTATRWAMVMIVGGVPTGATTARFVDHVIRRYRRRGVTVRAVLTDIHSESRPDRAVVVRPAA
jgi:hypothetical protein